MSFDYDPYQHIEVIHKPHGNYQLYCHSCGKEWGDWLSNVPVSTLFTTMADHVRRSHGRSREDFSGWAHT